MSFEEWKDLFFVLSCPVNCPWLLGSPLGNFCCGLGKRAAATILEEEDDGTDTNRRQMLGK